MGMSMGMGMGMATAKHSTWLYTASVFVVHTWSLNGETAKLKIEERETWRERLREKEEERERQKLNKMELNRI